MRKRKPAAERGYSLLELCISATLFSLLLVVIFIFFRSATRAFQTAVQRQGINADSLRVMDALQQELKRTSADSLVKPIGPRRHRMVRGTDTDRDAVCFLGLQDWRDHRDFVVGTGQPKWNRYWCFYASTDNDSGRFYRIALDFSLTLGTPTPMRQLDLARLVNDVPALNRYNGRPVVTNELARNVYGFSVQPDPLQNDAYVVSLTLQEVRAKRPGESGVNLQKWDTYQLQTRIRPENTFPSLPN